MNSPISDLDLQRLIDGELSEQEQQTLLTDLDAADDWRRVALAFVEEQVWSRVHDTEDERVPVGDVWKPDRKRRGVSWLAVSASAVIAAGLGFLAGNQTNRTAATTVADAPADAGQFVEPEPVMSLQFPSSNSDVEGSLNIPVYDSADTDYALWTEAPLLPDDVREQFFRRGYDVRQAREFFRIPLDDGSEIAVPVDTLHVRYDGL